MKIWAIEGYWKDTLTGFERALVSEYDDVPIGFDEDDIFHFGLSETDLKKAIAQPDNTIFDFVVTSYKLYAEI